MKFLILFCLLIVAIINNVDYRASRLLTKNGVKYYIGADNDRVPWYSAKSKCKSMGMDLLELHTVDEQLAFTETIHENRMGNLGWTWAGGSDEAHEGFWKWIKNDEEMIYQNWNNNEPSNSGNNEHCLNILGEAFNYRWNDFPCTGALPYNCYKIIEETTIAPTPAPTQPTTTESHSESRYETPETNLTPITPTVFRNTRAPITFRHGETTYFVSNTKENFYMARNYCLNMQFKLLELSTVTESNAFLQALESKNIDTQTWIGLTDDGSEGEFYWSSNGLNMEYNNFMTGEPNNKNFAGFPPGENCVATLSSSGGYKWMDIPCLQQFPFVCQSVNQGGSDYPDNSFIKQVQTRMDEETF